MWLCSLIKPQCGDFFEKKPVWLETGPHLYRFPACRIKPMPLRKPILCGANCPLEKARSGPWALLVRMGGTSTWSCCSMMSGSTLISIFDGRIEFVTIGGLVYGLTFNDIMLGVLALRNKKLVNVFYRLRLIEAYGHRHPADQ